MDNETVTLIHMDFRRTRIHAGTTTISVEYVLNKKTPFGLITLSKVIPYMTFTNTGAETMDGMVFDDLTHQALKEENARYMEAAATESFGIG